MQYKCFLSSYPCHSMTGELCSHLEINVQAKCCELILLVVAFKIVNLILRKEVDIFDAS